MACVKCLQKRKFDVTNNPSLSFQTKASNAKIGTMIRLDLYTLKKYVKQYPRHWIEL